MVYIDRNATFLCGIVNNAILYWTVNGSLTHQHPTNDIVDITTADGIMLTITARAQYNNTVIQCFAEERGVGDGFEESDNVTLTIQGRNNYSHNSQFETALNLKTTSDSNYTYWLMNPYFLKVLPVVLMCNNYTLCTFTACTIQP